MGDLKSEVKKKYAESGYDSLTEREKIILALSCTERKNKLEKSADKIIDVYGKLNIACNADTIFLMKECEISKKSAVFLTLIAQIRRRCDVIVAEKEPFDISENAKKYFTAFLREKKTELAVATAVSKNFHVIQTSVLAYGAFNEVHLPIRMLVEFALKYEAAYLFVAHCHPEASSFPSANDILTTKRIKEALDAVGVRFADHIITGVNGALSLRELEGNSIFDDMPEYHIV